MTDSRKPIRYRATDVDGGDDLTGRVIGCAIRVHRDLGPGFLENVYRGAMDVELSRASLLVEREKHVPIHYCGVQVGWHRLDFLIEHAVILEVKAVAQLGGAQYAQVRSYLRATGLSFGLLVNFATERADIRRVDLAMYERFLGRSAGS